MDVKIIFFGDRHYQSTNLRNFTSNVKIQAIFLLFLRIHIYNVTIDKMVINLDYKISRSEPQVAHRFVSGQQIEQSGRRK